MVLNQTILLARIVFYNERSLGVCSTRHLQSRYWWEPPA